MIQGSLKGVWGLSLGTQPRVKSLRSSYTGLYPQKGEQRHRCGGPWGQGKRESGSESVRKRDNEKGVLGLPARTARERPSLGAYASSGVPGSSACVTMQVKL